MDLVGEPNATPRILFFVAFHLGKSVAGQCVDFSSRRRFDRSLGAERNPAQCRPSYPAAYQAVNYAVRINATLSLGQWEARKKK